jgi:hypothetical protein
MHVSIRSPYVISDPRQPMQTTIHRQAVKHHSRSFFLLNFSIQCSPTFSAPISQISNSKSARTQAASRNFQPSTWTAPQVKRFLEWSFSAELSQSLIKRRNNAKSTTLKIKAPFYNSTTPWPLVSCCQINGRNSSFWERTSSTVFSHHKLLLVAN